MEQKRKRSSRLTENINSDFIAAYSIMRRKGVVMVYVEGYEDISFWRGILDEFETPDRKFEITTPVRGDLAKGKKVVLNFAPQAGENLILCVDSDFDYLFGNFSDQSRLVNSNKYVVQTYAYAIENLLCYPPSLDSIVVKATKNDAKIFDFEQFMEEYSRVVYPVFLWYVFAAKSNNPGIFPLSDFRNTVRINYLEVENSGEQTIEWLDRQVQKKLNLLRTKYEMYQGGVAAIENGLIDKGVTPATTHMYMQGHTLMDYVVKVVVGTVCDTLRKQWVDRIMRSTREGMTLRNELSYYNNSLRDIDSLLLDNIQYRESEQFKMIQANLHAIFTAKKSIETPIAM